MSNLIEKDALKRKHCDSCSCKSNCMGNSCKIYEARCLIADLPTIDAEPVKHGCWINDTFCSECKRFPIPAGVGISDKELSKYFSRCPHCGAVMDGGEQRCRN